MFPAIETTDLVKRYDMVTAVDRLSLRVNQGEIYAFLGLNGAGKTTTIRLLLGMVKPTSGHARLLGSRIDVRGEKPWERVGYMVETPYAYPELTVRENLEVIRRLRPGYRPEQVETIIGHLGLMVYADQRSGTLSHGNAQRLGLAKALMHHPQLLILDEPTNGLDPAGIVEIRELLLDLVHEQGVTVFMSSHLLDEVSRLVNRIGIIHRGKLIQEMNFAEIESNRKRLLRVRTRDNAQALGILRAAGIQANILEDGEIVSSDAAAIEQPDHIATLLVNNGCPPVSLNVKQEDLEHYFLRLVGMDEKSVGDELH